VTDLVVSIELIVAVFLLLAFISCAVVHQAQNTVHNCFCLTGVAISVVAYFVAQGDLRKSGFLQMKSIYNQLLQGGGGGLFVWVLLFPVESLKL